MSPRPKPVNGLRLCFKPPNESQEVPKRRRDGTCTPCSGEGDFAKLCNLPADVHKFRTDQRPVISASSYLDVAREAAAEAGKILADYFANGVVMRTKSSAVDLVSDADVGAERAIAAIILKHFPDHHILGEEENSGDVAAEHLWIIDPLDGTTNFAHGLPHFAVSIAYYQAGVAHTGVIFNPVRDDWYIAQRGHGARHNGTPIHVGEQSLLNEVLVGTGFYYDRGEMMERTLAAIGRLFRQQIRGIRRFGTASLDLAAVASGHFGAFFEYHLSPWDYAAGRLLIEEAGGKVTTCTGDTIPLEATSIIASNGRLHETLVGLVQSEG